MQIRTGMRSSWLAATAAVLVTGLLAFLPSGCGGSGETVVGPTPTPIGATPTPTPLRTANFKVQIDWGARSRVTGLSSALSARITLEKAGATNGDITWVENRPAGTAATSQSYTSPQPAKVGQAILSVKFFSEASGTGIEVGEAKASTTVLADGSLTVTIATYSTNIQTVELLPNQSVAVGSDKALDFTVKNANGAVVAQPPTIPDSLRGAVFFAVTAQPQNLSVVRGGSQVRGLHPSEAMVTATIDSATSAPTLVKVTSQTDIVITQDPVNGAASLGSEFPLNLSAVVTDPNAPAGERGVVWSIVGGASARNGSLTAVQSNSVTYVAPYLIKTETRDIVVRATSVYNPDKFVDVPIKVVAPATVVITPSPVNMSWEQSIDLTAVVNNLSPLIGATDSRREVRWEIDRDGTNPVGTFLVDSANPNRITYTAPKRDATITVRAISNYDSTNIGTVTINVTTAVAVNVVNPSPLAVPLKISVKRTQDFGVSLINIPPGKDGSVAWSITGPAGEANTGNMFGTITPLTATTALYTAPATQPGTGEARIIARSNYDTNATKTIEIQIVGGSLGIGIN